MKNFTAEQVISYLVKHGWNRQDAEKVVNANYEYARRTYPEATPSKIAEIVMILD